MPLLISSSLSSFPLLPLSFRLYARLHVSRILCSPDECGSYECTNDKWQSIGAHCLLSGTRPVPPKMLGVDRKVLSTCIRLAVMALS